MPIAPPTLQPEPTSPARPVIAKVASPPSKHESALMIWIAVFPTLIVLNLSVDPWLTDAGPVLGTFVVATIAVPIVYGIMPMLHRMRMRLLRRRAALPG